MAPDDTHNGRLEFHEVYSLDLNNTDLVVLSACQTQLRDLSAGDELVGLTRAFFFRRKARFDTNGAARWLPLWRD